VTARARYRCAVCDRPLKASRGRPCIQGCGARLCRVVRNPQCSDVHAPTCPHHTFPDDDMETAA
jgi:hypothetical protein